MRFDKIPSVLRVEKNTTPSPRVPRDDQGDKYPNADILHPTRVLPGLARDIINGTPDDSFRAPSAEHIRNIFTDSSRPPGGPDPPGRRSRESGFMAGARGRKVLE